MRRHLIRSGMLALACAALAATPAQAQLGSILGHVDDAVRGVQAVDKIGDAMEKIDEPKEIKIGGELTALLLGAAPLVEDPETQAYVSRVGLWLALHSERPNLPWRFGVIESDDFNAFSAPGGYVLVSRGLLEDMRSESELAGVLAHEIAHVVQRHQVKALQAALRNEAVSAMNDFTGATDSLGGGQFGRALLSAGTTMYTKGLDKGDEYEADRMGVVIATRAGYSPYGLAGVLQTLSGFNKKSKGFGLLFATHPSPVSRIEQLDAAMGTRLDPYPTQEDVPQFAGFKARFAPPVALNE
jgi:predicted Zn-dependent protease